MGARRRHQSCSPGHKHGICELGPVVLLASTAQLQGLPRAPRPLVEETAVDPLPPTRASGVGATVVSERTEEGATAKDDVAEKAAVVEASAERVTMEYAATDAATEDAVTKTADDVTVAADRQRSSVTARDR